MFDWKADLTGTGDRSESSLLSVQSNLVKSYWRYGQTEVSASIASLTTTTTTGSGKKRIGGCCVRIMAGFSVRVRIVVRDGIRISNNVRGRVKLENYSLRTALPTATSADPLFTRALLLLLLGGVCGGTGPRTASPQNFVI